MRSLTAFSLALTLAACGSDTGADRPTPAAGASETVAVVDPCEALTPAHVAAATGVPEASVTLDQEGLDEARRAAERFEMSMSEMCLYDFADGADYKSAQIVVQAYESADAAATAFATTYRTPTEAELDQAEAAVDEAVASGEVDADALEGVDVGKMIRGAAAAATYEPVPGATDAVVEINRIVRPAHVTQVHVRAGAVVYTVALAPAYPLLSGDGGPDAIRRAQEALARAVAGA